MAPSRQKPAREFIPVGVDESSDDDFAAILDPQARKEKPIGIDEDFSDDGEGLYSDDESEEEELEDDEADDDEEEVDEAEEGDEAEDEEGDELDDEDNEEGVSGEDEDDEDLEDGGFSGSEFSDGDPNEVAQEGDESEDESEIVEPMAKKPKGLGDLARKLASLEEEIAEFETKQMDKKHWTLTGEATGKARPLNSILESNLELPFGHMAGKRLDESRDLIVDENDFDPENPEKPKFDLDLIIKQRVADRTFDDVLRRKVDAVVHDEKPSDRLEGLDFEKSQLGLADVYAKQYEKDIFNQSDASEKQSAEKEEAKQAFAKLMHKLDCLTNFNFAPRPPVIRKAGADGVKDLPAMKLEEPIPLIISSSIRANL